MYITTDNGGPVGTILRAIYAIKTNTFTLQTRWVISSCSQPALRTKGKTPLGRLYNFSAKIQIVFHENLDSFFFKKQTINANTENAFLYNNDYPPPASLETPGKLQEQTLPLRGSPQRPLLQVRLILAPCSSGNVCKHPGTQDPEEEKNVTLRSVKYGLDLKHSKPGKLRLCPRVSKRFKRKAP